MRQKDRGGKSGPQEALNASSLPLGLRTAVLTSLGKPVEE